MPENTYNYVHTIYLSGNTSMQKYPFAMGKVNKVNNNSYIVIPTFKSYPICFLEMHEGGRSAKWHHYPILDTEFSFLDVLFVCLSVMLRLPPGF